MMMKMMKFLSISSLVNELGLDNNFAEGQTLTVLVDSQSHFVHAVKVLPAVDCRTPGLGAKGLIQRLLGVRTRTHASASGCFGSRQQVQQITSAHPARWDEHMDILYLPSWIILDT